MRRTKERRTEGEREGCGRSMKRLFELGFMNTRGIQKKKRETRKAINTVTLNYNTTPNMTKTT